MAHVVCKIDDLRSLGAERRTMRHRCGRCCCRADVTSVPTATVIGCRSLGHSAEVQLLLFHSVTLPSCHVRILLANQQTEEHLFCVKTTLVCKMLTTPRLIPCSTWTRTLRRLSAPQTVSVPPTAVPSERKLTAARRLPVRR